MKINILDIVSQALDLYDNSKKEEAIRLLHDYFESTNRADIGQKEYDLAMETYIFLTDGDLRKEGRDFGFTNTEEIKKEILNFKNTK
jgi:hypothetical protein